MDLPLQAFFHSRFYVRPPSFNPKALSSVHPTVLYLDPQLAINPLKFTWCCLPLGFANHHLLCIFWQILLITNLRNYQLASLNDVPMIYLDPSSIVKYWLHQQFNWVSINFIGLIDLFKLAKHCIDLYCSYFLFEQFLTIH